VGQPAAFSVDAYPGRIFTGTVTSIRKAPINVANVITYDAVVGISNLDLNLFPGMTANVKILVNQRSGVLRVSNAALRYHPAADPNTPAPAKGAAKGAALEKSVWILDVDDKPQRVALTTGETDGAFTEVLSGNLKDGDRTIVAAVASSSAPAASASPGAKSGSKGGRGPGF
jgi:HlyD family secretion protein